MVRVGREGPTREGDTEEGRAEGEDMGWGLCRERGERWEEEDWRAAVHLEP